MSKTIYPHYPFCIVPAKLHELEDFDSDDFQTSLLTHDLNCAMGYLNVNNHSGNLPYHNNRHMYGVAVVADYLYRTEVGFDGYSVDLERLIVAALMHDYQHSGGVQSDDVNVRRAMDAIPYIYFRGVPYIQQMIAITEYPFKHEPRSISEKCLRDADLLYATLSNEPAIVMEGLRAEMIASRGEDITRADMVKGQKAFMQSAVLYTDAGRILFDRFTPEYIRSLEEYAANKTSEA